MDIATINYLEQQFFQVAPLPLNEDHFPRGFDLQIRGEGRKTNYLKITPEQLRKIEQVLLGVI